MLNWSLIRLRSISIHAPVKGATLLLDSLTAGSTNFNPRSREGSDDGARKPSILASISIHAPVKGATKIIRNGEMSVVISIHAPVKGATLQIAIKIERSEFQSTLP